MRSLAALVIAFGAFHALLFPGIGALAMPVADNSLAAGALASGSNPETVKRWSLALLPSVEHLLGFRAVHASPTIAGGPQPAVSGSLNGLFDGPLSRVDDRDAASPRIVIPDGSSGGGDPRLLPGLPNLAARAVSGSGVAVESPTAAPRVRSNITAQDILMGMEEALSTVETDIGCIILPEDLPGQGGPFPRRLDGREDGLGADGLDDIAELLF